MQFCTLYQILKQRDSIMIIISEMKCTLQLHEMKGLEDNSKCV